MYTSRIYDRDISMSIEQFRTLAYDVAHELGMNVVSEGIFDEYEL